MAKIPKLPKGATGWAPEDRTPAFLRGEASAQKTASVSRGIYDHAELSEVRARYWLSMDGWTAMESALLLCAIDPGAIELLEARPGGTEQVLRLEWPLHFDDLHRLVVRAVEAGVLGAFAAPTAVLEWADTKDLRMPAPMIKFRANRAMHSDGSKVSDRHPTRPVQRKVAHKAAILDALQSLGFDPKKLPAPPPGKQFPEKAASRNAVSLSHDVFNKAWQELLNEGAIVVKQP